LITARFVTGFGTRTALFVDGASLEPCRRSARAASTTGNRRGRRSLADSTAFERAAAEVAAWRARIAGGVRRPTADQIA